MHDRPRTGKKLSVLSVVDTFLRCVPVLDAKFSYRGEDVRSTLDGVCLRTGCPKTIPADPLIDTRWSGKTAN